MSNRKPTEDQYIQVCHSCIAQINERFIYEKSLFRNQSPAIETRNLKVQLLAESSASVRLKSESDPSIITGVLILCLREMPLCLFHEVYEDVVRLDVTDEVDACKASIGSWIVNIPPIRFELVRNISTCELKLYFTIGLITCS